MTNLIERFLDVNRIESGHQKIKPELFNLVEIIQNQINNFKLQAQEKLLEVRFEYPNPNLEVESDKQIITLIFVNLLSNAIKFSGFNKLIEVEITMDTQNYWLHIRDQGPGMTEQDKLLVFKKYTRLSARPTANETSTGLGLYLVKKMSEKINAEILFESTLGVGTEMKVKIPFNIGRPV